MLHQENSALTCLKHDNYKMKENLLPVLKMNGGGLGGIKPPLDTVNEKIFDF